MLCFSGLRDASLGGVACALSRATLLVVTYPCNSDLGIPNATVNAQSLCTFHNRTHEPDCPRGSMTTSFARITLPTIVVTSRSRHTISEYCSSSYAFTAPQLSHHAFPSNALPAIESVLLTHLVPYSCSTASSDRAWSPSNFVEAGNDVFVGHTSPYV
jgi:hypothetical protein